jgi:hypothetical protein
LDSVTESWKYLDRGKDADQVGLYPNAPDVQFRAAVNVITDNLPHKHEVPGGNSFFSAGKLSYYQI